MLTRIVLFTGIIATLVAVAEPAAARPRRFGRLSRVETNNEKHENSVAAPFKTVIHPVADLVVPVSSLPNLDVEPLPRLLRTNESTAAPRNLAAWNMKTQATLPGQTLERQLMDLIRESTAPNTWLGNGGSGTVQYYPLGMSLVVNQTLAVQEEVAALLESIRRLHDVEAAVELRMVTTSPAAWAKACAELKLTPVAVKEQPEAIGMRSVAPRGKRWSTFLDQAQTARLLDKLESDRTTTVMQAPKIMMFGGQNVALDVTQNRFFLTSIEVVAPNDNGEVYLVPSQLPWLTGLSLGMQSVVSADRRFVRVRMKGTWSELAGPVELQPLQMPVKSTNDQGKVETTVFQMFLQMPRFAQVRLDEELTIADGGAALVSCGVLPMEVERDDPIACITRFFGGDKLTTSADRHVFFLITPRVIVNETEANLQGSITELVSPKTLP